MEKSVRQPFVKLTHASGRVPSFIRAHAVIIALALVTAFAFSGALYADKLDLSGSSLYDYSGTNGVGGPVLPPNNLHILSDGQNNPLPPGFVTQSKVAIVTDNNPGTYITLGTTPALLIDLGKISVVHRVYAIGSTNQLWMWPNYSANSTNPPLGLIAVYVGNTTTNTNMVATYTVPYDAGNPIETEMDLRFSPAVGRYVRLELHPRVAWGTTNWPGFATNSLSAPLPPPQTSLTWNIGELEIYGFSGAAVSQTNVNAVVLPAGAAAPLALAASELSYYLGELTGSPYPIVPPSRTNQFTGKLYTIVDQKALAPTYSTMMSNIASGRLSTNITVTMQGNQVVFSGWPYRTILWEVWDFLEQQGVRWVYPDCHSDYVPKGNGVNLSILPRTCSPPTYSIYANFDINVFQPWPSYELQSVRSEYLYPWRNHWTYSEVGPGPLGGSEIPTQPATGVTINSNYTEGFLGYPHNFSSVVPNRILMQHTNWWGWATTTPGSQVTPGTSGAPTFTMDDPTLISWVANKMTNIAAANPLAVTFPLNIAHWHRPYSLLPLDASIYSQDPYTIASNGPAVPDPVPWVKEYGPSYSGMYYSFVTSVAKQVQQLSPNSVPLVGALAYADVFLPPTNIPALSVFPTNVQVEVCLYGAPNLPMTAAPNAGLKAALDGWSTTCSHLATYDYALLHTDYAQTNPAMPVALVAGTLARSQYLGSIGALDGGSQGNVSSLPYNPWNFYAYPRTRWNTNQTAAQIEQEFFTGYFGEAAAPMLAYYQAMENFQVTNGINLYYAGYCYAITPGSFPLPILTQMKTNLDLAQAQATNWWVANRLAPMVEGFNWLLPNAGYSLDALADPSGYPVFDNSQTNVNLSLFHGVTNCYTPADSANGYQPPGSYWIPIGGGLALFSKGYMRQTLNFVQGGTYQMIVNAKGVSAGGAAPILNICAGGNEASFTLSSAVYANYSQTVTIPPGVWDIFVSFPNPTTGTRQAFVDGIKLVPQ